MENVRQAVASPGLGAGDFSREWRPLRYFNLYRATVAGLFTLLAVEHFAPRVFGQSDPRLFVVTAISYFVFSIAASFTIRARWPAFDVQVFLQVLADIVAITLMMHASGGVAGGFGVLLVVAVAGGSILTQGRIAILFAAMASLAVLLQQVYSYFYDPFPVSQYTQAGVLGVAFFATAILAFTLARRIRTSEALAAKRGVDLENLAQLNEHIIQRMQSGILAVDGGGIVRLINYSARALLGAANSGPGMGLRFFSPELAELFKRWSEDSSRTTHVFQPARMQVEVMASFAGLGRSARDGALVFLEDVSAMRQRAQKLKLASLGRLTASIAHEIRNPLGAISHAGQLLGESAGLSAADQRLTQIVKDNCQRMNGIVENVLQLSRRNASVPESFELKAWLDSFAGHFADTVGINGAQITVTVEPPELRVRIDPSQLQQVLQNLCENGIRHSEDGSGLSLVAGMHPESERPYLDVIDQGEGMSEELVDQIFEPFFTTASAGTGLGLYIARELCESNQASLNLVSTGRGGSRFRITFSDPRRQGGVAA